MCHEPVFVFVLSLSEALLQYDTQNKSLGVFVRVCRTHKWVFMLKHLESLSRYTIVIRSQITSRIKKLTQGNVLNINIFPKCY